MAAPMARKLRHLQLSYSRLFVTRKCGSPGKSTLRTVTDNRGPDESSSVSTVSMSEDTKIPQVGMSTDGSTLICWHPEVPHPYEHTQPISHDKHEFRVGEGVASSVLKDQVLRDYLTRYRPDGPNMQELTNITYTTKHQWYPKPQKKFRKRNPPKDRESI